MDKDYEDMDHLMNDDSSDSEIDMLQDKWERLKEEIKKYKAESDTEESWACESILKIMEQIEKE